jgi:hypothetical protein
MGNGVATMALQPTARVEMPKCRNGAPATTPRVEMPQSESRCRNDVPATTPRVEVPRQAPLGRRVAAHGPRGQSCEWRATHPQADVPAGSRVYQRRHPHVRTVSSTGALGPCWFCLLVGPAGPAGCHPVRPKAGTPASPQARRLRPRAPAGCDLVRPRVRTFTGVTCGFVREASVRWRPGRRRLDA